MFQSMSCYFPINLDSNHDIFMKGKNVMPEVIWNSLTHLFAMKVC